MRAKFHCAIVIKNYFKSYFCLSGDAVCPYNHDSSLGHANAGFTLVELMIAITLGLLLVAAATQLFFSGIVSSRLQSAGADIQNSGVFGLDFMAKDVRLANSGNSNYLQITDQTPMGGLYCQSILQQRIILPTFRWCAHHIVQVPSCQLDL